LAVVAAGCRGGTAEAPAAAAPLAVATARAEKVEWPSTFEAGGIVRARTTAAIASRLLAPVVTVHVRAGDRVKRGAPLVTLEAREIAAAQARARAASSGSDDGVRAAAAVVRSAEAALTFARATHDRIRGLHETRSATAHELDQATAALDAAQAQLASARANLAAAEASRTAAGAAVDAATAALSYSTLTAPFDGIVTARAVDPGDMAAPGVRLLTLEEPGAVRLEVALDEARATMVSTSQPARVALGHTESESWIDATVAEIARVDPASHSFLVKLDLPAAVQRPSGTFGRARFDGATREAVVIPATAAIRRGQLTFVFAVDDGDRARLQPISPGARADGRLEVLAGLAANARVVREPGAALADGTIVAGSGR
jgi:multidrug efflux pump subunit AcrA (membrane-fusion protein)